tara:strand:- start:3367 stop:3768 length:402 start_codon:yes stop_codon:yes gene_type:complete
MDYDYYLKKRKPGPWTNEPDRVEFLHYAVECIVLRTTMGHLCGYVKVPVGHPWHGQGYEEIDIGDYCPHGGLTFSGSLIKGAPEEWWVGFDCAHLDDLIPTSTHYDREEVYRDIEYVTNQVKDLANELTAAKK